jgi:tRNA threonylcarbamoyladenosine biosynthesis protein TsaB
VRLLALDTAGPCIGVALRIGEQVSIRTERVTRGAETRLAPWTLELCSDAGIAMSQLDGVSASLGPGAFTGVRVGLSTAIGICMAIERPFWGCSSLDSRASRVAGEQVLALLDARKGRVYAALYRDGKRVFGPSDVAFESALAWVDGPFIATGEGALLAAEAIRRRGGALAQDADHPAVDALALLASAAIERGDGMNPLQVQPLYVRAPDAQKPSGDIESARSR